MARLTAKERRERKAALVVLVRQSREQWLGKRVQFIALLDKQVKQGMVTEVDDEGWVTVEYAPYPWSDVLDGELCIVVGHEAEVLTLVDE